MRLETESVARRHTVSGGAIEGFAAMGTFPIVGEEIALHSGH
jgi:hypothetical protein